jgi:hypothetical protein
VARTRTSCRTWRAARNGDASSKPRVTSYSIIDEEAPAFDPNNYEDYARRVNTEAVELKNNSTLSIKNVIGAGREFQDLLELEGFLEKNFSIKESMDYVIRCERSVPIRSDPDPYHKLIKFFMKGSLEKEEESEDNILDDLDDEEEVEEIEEKPKNKPDKKKPTKKELKAKKKEDEMKKEMEALEAQIMDIKEFKFITDCGMDRDVAQHLDIPMRLNLERIFPQLAPFPILCFKRDATIMRKAFVYPTMENEDVYLDTMRALLSTEQALFNDQLKSKVKISFKGKHVLKINRNLYSNFSETIEKILDEHDIKSYVNEYNQKIELQIVGQLDRNPNSLKCPATIRDAYQKIVEILSSEDFVPNADPYNLYGIFNSQSEDCISKLNNMNCGEFFIDLNSRFRKVVIRGKEESRKKAAKELNFILSKFNNSVQKKEWKPKSFSAFIGNRVKLDELAKDHKYLLSVKDESILIFYNTSLDGSSGSSLANKSLAEKNLSEFISTSERIMEPPEANRRRPHQKSTLLLRSL